jgi:SAM-dependent methyltransferase
MIRIPRKTLQYCAQNAHVDSPIYHTGSWPVRELQWRKLEALIRMAEGETGRALDLCCGNGVLLPTLSRMFAYVTAIDIHTTAARRIVELFELKNVAVSVQDAYRLPFEKDYPATSLRNSTFDCIFAASCLEHFSKKEAITKTLHHMLKPYGKLYVLTPTENLLYCVGRKLLGYTKPADHYWTAREIDNALTKRFNPITLKFYPSALLPIYRMGVWRKS